ncbi:hypothetical protein ACFXA3_00285 [Streptomyces sp. NPDC059456]|uniref:hypothetical protein n=1 Tax=Streptomyces sp. NPDC059456 TaxID=3346838 RepID=UPI0036C42963
MGRTWNGNKPRDIRDFERWLRKGATVYVINRLEHAGDARLWNHPETWSSYTVTGKHPLLGDWQINSSSAEYFLKWHGTVYDTQPRGIPHHSSSGPRVAGPLPEEVFEMTMKEIQYAADEAEDRANADLKAGRRKRTSWF